MKKILITVPMIALLAACATPEQNVGIGALTGAAIGASVAGSDDELEATLIGAAVGAAAGAAISNQQARNCTYRNNATGQTYTAPCQ